MRQALTSIYNTIISLPRGLYEWWQAGKLAVYAQQIQLAAEAVNQRERAVAEREIAAQTKEAELNRRETQLNSRAANLDEATTQAATRKYNTMARNFQQVHQAEIAQHTQTLRDLNIQIERSRQEANRLGAQTQRLQSHVDLQAQVTQLTAENHQLQDQIQHEQYEYARLQSALDRADDRLKRTEDKLDDAREDKRELKRDKHELASDLRATQRDYAKLARKNSSTTYQYHDHRQYHATLNLDGRQLTSIFAPQDNRRLTTNSLTQQIEQTHLQHTALGLIPNLSVDLD